MLFPWNRNWVAIHYSIKKPPHYTGVHLFQCPSRAKSVKSRKQTEQKSHAEVDGRRGGIIGVDGEAHAQQLDVSFDVEAESDIDFTLCICLGADIQTDRRATLRALQGTLKDLVLDRLVVAGEVHLQRASGRSEAGLGLTEGSETCRKLSAHRAGQGGYVQLVTCEVEGDPVLTELHRRFGSRTGGRCSDLRSCCRERLVSVSSQQCLHHGGVPATVRRRRRKDPACHFRVVAAATVALVITVTEVTAPPATAPEFSVAHRSEPPETVEP